MIQIKQIYINGAKKIENIIFLAVILFVYKIIFEVQDSIIYLIINEILVLITFGAITTYTIDIVKIKIVNPIPIIVNIGIFNAIIFFFSSASGVFDSSTFINLPEKNILENLIAILISFLVLFSIAYILATFRGLFGLYQKKDNSSIFNTMLIFMGLGSLANTLFFYESSYSYVKDSFFVVSIILIFINSLRVAWIAFLSKKQKISLLFLSIILFSVFIINAILSHDSVLAKELMSFSPSLSFLMQLLMIYGAIYFGVIFFTALFHLPTAEAFDRKAEELSSLMDLSSLMTQVFDFKELAESVTKITNKVCNSHSSWLLTFEDKELVLNAAENISIVDAERITNYLFDKNNYSLNEVKALNEDELSELINNFTQIIDFKNISVAPLKVKDKTNGFLFAARKDSLSFDEDDKKAISSFADYAAVALENAKLITESIEKERMEKELDVAREVQNKLLPAKTPVYENFETVATFIPAFEVGGDYYDFFEIKEDLFGFVVADVSGKGISSAFIMAEIKGIFQSLSSLLEKPKDILVKANEILKNSLDKKSFVTAIYGTIDINTGRVNLVRGGHTPIIYWNNNKIDLLTPKGIGLGLDYGKKFINNLKELEFYLKNDDILVLFSDGITESKNDKLEDFGIDRLESVIRENCNKKVDEIANGIMKEVSLFSQNYKQHDDITLVIFKWKFKNKTSEIINGGV